MPMSWENLNLLDGLMKCLGRVSSYLVVIDPRSVVVKRDNGARMTVDRRRLCREMPDLAATETRTNQMRAANQNTPRTCKAV